MASQAKRVSIVIPVYNGEATIAPLVSELISSLRTLYPVEIVLVNDGSTDGSEEACISLFRTYPDIVKFYSLAKNVGEHNAVIAGLNQAHGDYMVIMDDDFQNPVSAVIKLIDYAMTHDDDVVYTFYQERKHARWRNLGSNLHNRLAGLFLKKPPDLYLSSFKCLNRFAVDEIIKYDLPFPYIDGLVLRMTDKIGRVEVEHHPRPSGKSGYNLKRLLELWLSTFTAFSILPLRVAMVLGLVLSLGGFIFGAVTIIEKILNPGLAVGYPSLVVVIMIFFGAVLMTLGVIGEYVGRIYIAQSRKPQFTIRRRFEKTCAPEDHGKE
jgi:glycosyltransferase involved in cell wall biosynthesis